MDLTAIASYNQLTAKCALDQYTDSWAGMPLGPPLRRVIPANAHLANSVALRLAYALTYKPSNLVLENRLLGKGYAVVPVLPGDAI
jgi:hypothetical protein